jgi:quinol monooxygenase YgiN
MAGLKCLIDSKERKSIMVNVALFVRLEAKPGKEAAVAEFLRGALPLVEKEPATNPWFAVQMGPSSFAIFDAFPDDAGRETHLNGPVGAALKEKASELFAQPPMIEKLNVLAAKVPQ